MGVWKQALQRLRKSFEIFSLLEEEVRLEMPSAPQTQLPLKVYFFLSYGHVHLCARVLMPDGIGSSAAGVTNNCRCWKPKSGPQRAAS